MLHCTARRFCPIMEKAVRPVHITIEIPSVVCIYYWPFFFMRFFLKKKKLFALNSLELLLGKIT